MRNIKVGDNLSGKQLYLNFPDDLDLGHTHKVIIASENGSIDQTQANVISLGLDIETSDYEGIDLFDDGSGQGEFMNLATCIVPDEFGVVTSIDEASLPYKYIQIIEEENYIRCGSHCKHEAYSKEEINFLLDKKANNSNVDKKFDNKVDNSDVYSKNNFIVLTGEVSLSSGSGTATINYPDGLTKNNCVVLSVGVAAQVASCYDFGCHATINTEVRLTDSNIQLISKASSGPTGNRSYKIVFLKID